jgi:NitT/TauT family transport system substrate-binding protein
MIARNPRSFPQTHAELSLFSMSCVAERVGIDLAVGRRCPYNGVMHMRPNLNRGIAALAAALLVLTGLAAWMSRAPTSPNALTDVTISQYGDLLIYLPLYIAQDQGFFKQQGLNVRFINGGGDDKTFATLVAGSAQFGVSDPTFAAIAREKGQRAVVVGTVVAGAAYWGVTWNDAIKPTTNAIGLRNLRLATYEAPSTNYALMANTLKAHRAEMGTASIIQGSYGSLLAMLRADKADVAMELEPVASTAVKEGAHIVFSYPEMYGPFLLTGLYVLEDYRDQNRKTVQSVVNALEEAMRFAHANPSGAIEVAHRKFPEVDIGILRSAVKRMIDEDTLPKHVIIDQRGWDNAVKVRIELGDVKSRVVADETLDRTFSMNAIERE